MEYTHDDLPEIIDAIDPTCLDYLEWTQVGMALKACGFTVDFWDRWSAKDPARYHEGECERKWKTFTQDGVSSGTVIHIAESHGVDLSYIFEKDEAIGWDDAITLDYRDFKTKRESDGDVFVDRSWVEGEPIHVPSDADWDPIADMTRYIDALFEGTDCIAYVTEAWKRDGKWIPTQGIFTRTADQVIKDLNHYRDIGMAIGDPEPEAGAWIRFNPFDGKGVRDANVTDFRYSLVESDAISKEMQYALIKQLELPVVALVDSGNKSLHAIVKIDANNYDEYRKRVDSLYTICRKNGLIVDTNNKNPSRLSRLPGVVRGGKKQWLVATNIGKQSWAEWWEWVQAINDDLPEPEGLESVWDDLPELAPPLIDGVLRQGHKMLIAGPSKAGKSYALIELCIAIAEGKKWLGWGCAQGRVLYVNLELDRPSALHRFREVYEALGYAPANIRNIDIWNLRGKSVPMDKLAPKLIRRSLKKGYIAVIIDPIYKVITGDENSADQMAQFCNSFDLVASQLGCAVIYCHHHSKGAQGGKRSMDRASGSGVFARDPDALIDMVELSLTEECKDAHQGEVDWALMQREMNSIMPAWREMLTPDQQAGPVALCAWASTHLAPALYQRLLAIGEQSKQEAKHWTAWRLEGTLREFPKFGEKNVWFEYPLHTPDLSGALADLMVEGEYVDLFSEKGKQLRNKGREKAVEKNKELQKAKVKAMRDALQILEDEGVEPTRENVLNAINDNELFEKEITPRTIKEWTGNRSKWSPFRIKEGTDVLYDTNEEPGSPFGWEDAITGS